MAVLADMQQRLASNGGGASLKAFERVRDVHISLEPFTADNGLLTPSLKLKRFIAKKRYQKELDSLYSAASAAEMRDRRPSNPGKPPPPTSAPMIPKPIFILDAH